MPEETKGNLALARAERGDSQGSSSSAPAPRRDEMDVFHLGDVIAQSGYFTDAKQAAQAIVKVLAGRELGFGPIASMAGVYIINGKPSLSANLMAAAIKRSGKYSYRILHLDDKRCDIAFFEQGEQLVPDSTFTWQDAETAGLLTGPNKHSWTKFPRNMLFARALSNGARWHCPDIFGGPVFTPEEMNAPVSAETGEVINVAPEQVQEQVAARGASQKQEVASQSEASAARAAKVQEIMTTCRLLNEAGDQVEVDGKKVAWKSTSLASFINKEFEVEEGLQSLSFESLSKLQGMLSLRLDKYTAQAGQTTQQSLPE